MGDLESRSEAEVCSNSRISNGESSSRESDTDIGSVGEAEV